MQKHPRKNTFFFWDARPCFDSTESRQDTGAVPYSCSGRRRRIAPEVEENMIQFFGKHHNSQYFDRQKIQSIAIRAGSRLDALVINGVRYGGDGGGLSETLTLRPSEHINCVIVRSGSSIDGIDIYTNHGRHIGGGGNGGAEHIVTGRLLAIGGWHDNLMRGLEIETVAEDSQQVLRFGDLNSPDFAVSPIQSIALRSGSLVDGIIINGTQYGGGGGGLSQTLTLQSGEFISRVVVRHDNHLTHKLEFYTNYNRSLIGGGGGGWSTTIDGKLLGLGGKSLNNFLGGFATWIDRDRACTFANLAAANRFAPQAIQSIALRSGSLIDAIIINGTQYGGGGGGLSETLTLQSGEFITRVLVRHDGWTIHRLDFFTSNGRQLSGGGNGGSEHVIEGNLRAIGGATSNMVNGLTLTVGPDPIEVVSYGGGGGASFPMHWVENRNTIRIDHDFRYYSSNRVEALVLDGQRYGGSDDIDGSSSLTLGQGEFINKILVRHGSRVDRLEISTSRNRKVTGGGNGGTQDIYHGRVRALGGRAGGALDRLTVMGRRGVIDNSPSMQDVGGT
ncbi:MAG: jacalin-like lectin, partial [Nannocystaceae bacterium]